MTTKSMAYDHPAYTAVRTVALEALGASAKSVKYAAFTAELLKSVTVHYFAAASSADVLSLITISGTTTTTTAISTSASASPALGAFVNVPVGTASGGILLNQGDGAYLIKGTDATVDYGISLELVTQPLANVTQ